MNNNIKIEEEINEGGRETQFKEQGCWVHLQKEVMRQISHTDLNPTELKKNVDISFFQ